MLLVHFHCSSIVKSDFWEENFTPDVLPGAQLGWMEQEPTQKAARAMTAYSTAQWPIMPQLSCSIILEPVSPIRHPEDYVVNIEIVRFK